MQIAVFWGRIPQLYGIHKKTTKELLQNCTFDISIFVDIINHLLILA